MTQPVIEAMTARYFVQRGYLIWTDLDIDDGHNGDVDVIACNVEELVVAECKDNAVQDIEGVVGQMERAWAYVQSHACPHAPLTHGRRVRKLLVAPRAETGEAAWARLQAALQTHGADLMEADMVIKDVVAHERVRLQARAPRYGRQPDTILNLVKWMVARDWLKM